MATNSDEPSTPGTLPAVKRKRTLPVAARPYMWRPGQASPNPGGRPKNASLTAKLRDVLAQDSGKGDGATVADLVVEALLKLALDPKHPDRQALLAVIEHTDGKAHQSLSLEASPTAKLFDVTCNPSEL